MQGNIPSPYTTTTYNKAYQPIMGQHIQVVVVVVTDGRMGKTIAYSCTRRHEREEKLAALKGSRGEEYRTPPPKIKFPCSY